MTYFCVKIKEKKYVYSLALMDLRKAFDRVHREAAGEEMELLQQDVMSRLI